jgi:hypothetical protein
MSPSFIGMSVMSGEVRWRLWEFRGFGSLRNLDARKGL